MFRRFYVAENRKFVCVRPQVLHFFAARRIEFCIFCVILTSILIFVIFLVRSGWCKHVLHARQRFFSVFRIHGVFATFFFLSDASCVFFFIQHSLDETAKFQLIEYFANRLFVLFFAFQLFERDVDWYVGLDCGKKFRQLDFIDVFFHIHLLFSLELVGRLQQVLDRSELVYQFYGRLLPYPRTPRNVVGRIPHQAQEVDDLKLVFNPVFIAYFFHSHDFERSVAGLRFVHIDMFVDELSVVFVWSHHVDFNVRACKSFCQRSNHVVCFVVLHLNDRNSVSCNDFLDDRDSESNGLWCLFPLCLIFRIEFMSESSSFRVETHANKVRILPSKHFFERVYESEYGRCVFSFAVDSWYAYKCIICSVDERICVE